MSEASNAPTRRGFIVGAGGTLALASIAPTLTGCGNQPEEFQQSYRISADGTKREPYNVSIMVHPGFGMTLASVEDAAGHSLYVYAFEGAFRGTVKTILETIETLAGVATAVGILREAAALAHSVGGGDPASPSTDPSTGTGSKAVAGANSNATGGSTTTNVTVNPTITVESLQNAVNQAKISDQAKTTIMNTLTQKGPTVNLPATSPPMRHPHQNDDQQPTYHTSQNQPSMVREYTMMPTNDGRFAYFGHIQKDVVIVAQNDKPLRIMDTIQVADDPGLRSVMAGLSETGWKPPVREAAAKPPAPTGRRGLFGAVLAFNN